VPSNTDLQLAWAGLAAYALNDLETARCCPCACAACAGLLTLFEQGLLSAVLLPYASMGTHVWWDHATEQVRWVWVQTRWCDPAYCPHGEEEEP
jgi:hypothetical protein